MAKEAYPTYIGLVTGEIPKKKKKKIGAKRPFEVAKAYAKVRKKVR